MQSWMIFGNCEWETSSQLPWLLGARGGAIAAAAEIVRVRRTVARPAATRLELTLLLGD